jgi:hypothetical protein
VVAGWSGQVDEAAKILLSFLTGGALVAGCTLAAERFGTNVGGVVGGFPSTIAVTLLFVAIVISPQAAAEATDMVPLVLAFNAALLVCFAATVRRGLLLGIATALSLWGVLVLGALALGATDFTGSILVFVPSLLLGHHILHKRLRVPVCGGQRVPLTAVAVLARAVFSGTVIAAAVWLSKICGPVVGGVFSVFPAVFVTTLIIASRSRGAEFARALTRPLLVSGMINVAVYALAVRYLYPSWGTVAGTAGAFLVAGLTAYGTYVFVQR